MKAKLTTLLFFFIILFFGQSQDNWLKVYQLEKDGKTKEVLQEVEKLYQNAKKNNLETELVTCFLYQSKFIQLYDKQAQNTIILNLQKEIIDAKPISKALFNYIYATILSDYYNNNRYRLLNKSNETSTKNTDIFSWSKNDFENEINNAFLSSLNEQQLLEDEILNEYPQLFDISPISKLENATLYAFLFDTVCTYFYSVVQKNSNYKKLSYSKTAYYETSANFINTNLAESENKNWNIFIKLLQDIEKKYLKSNPEACRKYALKRMLYFKNLIPNSTLLMKQLVALEKESQTEELKQEIRLERVILLKNQAEKTDVTNQLVAAKSVLDTIFNSKKNTWVLQKAENLNTQITATHLEVKLKKEWYPKEVNRVFVRYKNTDSITIRFYKIPVYKAAKVHHSIKRDSILLSWITSKKTYLELKKQVHNPVPYFEFSTELLLEKLELGNYIITFETNTNSENPSKSLAVETICVSQFAIQKQENSNQELFSIFDKKTGKAIQNVTATFEKKKPKSLKSNQKGIIAFKKRTEKEKINEKNCVFLTKDDDSSFYYFEPIVYSEVEKQETVYKPKLYFDRAIYRPGQKIYYKGIIFQKNESKKSTTPFLTVGLTLYDASHNKIEKFDVQTNAMGSFSGTIQLPKTGNLGQYYIEINEAEDYSKDKLYYKSRKDEHIIWDEFLFDSDTFYFQVEEYKRPTFEIQFDSIKENYTIGSAISIKGNAKSLSDTPIANAKVAYTISRTLFLDNNTVLSDKNFMKSTTKTNEKGNFEIAFKAEHEKLKLDSIQSISYEIEVAITASNGETRTKNKEVNCNQKMLQLQIYGSRKMMQEEPITINIGSTTYNGFEIKSKGILKISYLDRKKFLKNRAFPFPELASINRSDFEKLFPFEPYSVTDEVVTEKEIVSIPYDTNLSKTINLDFLSKEKTGNYKIEISANDAKGNTISTTFNFELIGSNKRENQKKLFIVTDISKKESSDFEIEIYSEIPDLWINSRHYEGEKFADEMQLNQLQNGKLILQFPKNKTKVHDFHFSTFWENDYFAKTLHIENEKIDTAIPIEIERFRNKIEPGSIENWSFKITNPKLETEILASMYDISLDHFKKDYWRDATFYNYDKLPKFPDFVENNLRTIQLKQQPKATRFFTSFSKEPNFIWHGFNFINPNSNEVKQKHFSFIEKQLRRNENIGFKKGIIYDQLGPNAGIKVVNKGTNQSTITNFDGEFEINAIIGDTITIFHYDGNAYDYVIKSNGYLEIFMLIEEIEQFDKNVVTALGIKKATKNVSYSITTENTLSGYVNGVNVTNTSGVPGGSTRIVLRGSTSIKDDKEMLYIIDGEPVTASSISLNEANIESVVLLKSEEATALYGSRGANGVVIISTTASKKELKQIKTRTNFNETAFFFPHIKTDAKGKFSFQFTNPESLTTWKLRLFAHDKNANIGQLETNIISQKEIMLQTFMPRFMRELDTITLKVTIANSASITQNGTAMLSLFDAATGKEINEIIGNKTAIQQFSCQANGSETLLWTLSIPKGLQGLHYKIVAKTEQFSDGEENIIPVLPNKILITESYPVFVPATTTKTIEIENLHNSKSQTQQNFKLQIDYTGNPTILLLKALPYLINFEHDCAEQTFSKYFGNAMASNIIQQNNAFKLLLQEWEKNPEEATLKANEALKNIQLQETPWLLDAQSEATKNKQLATLLSLPNLEKNKQKALQKLNDKQLPSGAFAWFDGGSANAFITQHLLASMGHLLKLLPNEKENFDSFIQKGIPYLDQTILKKKKENSILELHNLYARSFFIKELPLKPEVTEEVAKTIKSWQSNWTSFSLYQKALVALVAYRFGDEKFAKEIGNQLVATAILDEETGMHWLENINGTRWHQSETETQVLLLETIAEILNDTKSIEALKLRLLYLKKNQHWPSTKATSEAIFAMLNYGTKWIDRTNETSEISVGNQIITNKNTSENPIIPFSITYKESEIKKEMASIKFKNTASVPGYATVYWHYFEDLKAIQSSKNETLSVQKNIYKLEKTGNGNLLHPIKTSQLIVGDVLVIQIQIQTTEQLDFVHLKDNRAACYEPLEILSTHEYKDGLSYYRSTKDASTNFFFDSITPGNHSLEYEVVVTNIGIFQDGIANLQSMYAPELSTFSNSQQLKINAD